MSWTKRQLIVGALEEIGIASYEFDISPEQFESALRRMDSMMAEWNVQGIRVGYPLSTIAESSIAQDSGVPDSATEAIITNLAMRIAPSYGKEAPRATKVTAKKAYSTLQMRALAQNPQNKQYPATLPTGAGNRRFGNNNSQNFFPTPTDEVDVGPDSILELN